MIKSLLIQIYFSTNYRIVIMVKKDKKFHLTKEQVEEKI